MAPTIVQDYQQQLIQTILDLSQQQNWWSSPLNLGGGEGPEGGSGVPVGDIFGQLIQSKVAFDTTEAAILDIPVSGASLVTNLDRIRYRIQTIEGSGGVYKGVGILDNSLFLASGITDLNFVNFVTTVSGMTATISGGIEIQWLDGYVASGVTILNFDGAGVTAVVDDDHHKVTVTISGVTDHGDLGGLGDDDHTQYLLLDGRSGGQLGYGGTDANDNLFLVSTSHSTKGHITLSGKVLTGDSLPTAPFGTMHVRTADSTAGNASSIADELVVESSNHGGITILTAGGGNDGRFYFGRPGLLDAGRIVYRHDLPGMTFSTEATNIMTLYTTGVAISPGVGLTSPDGTLHILTASAGAISASSEADSLVVEDSVHGGISILEPDNQRANIYFGSPTDSSRSRIINDGPNSRFRFATNWSTLAFDALSGGEIVFNPDSGDVNFRVEGNTDLNLLFADAGTDRVGIGINNPGVKLDVDGEIRSLPITGNSTLFALRPNDINTNAFVTFDQQGSGGKQWNMGLLSGDAAGDFYIQGFDGSSLQDYVVIDRGTGDVGIGTTTPGTLLELASTTGAAELTINGTAASNNGILLENAGVLRWFVRNATSQDFMISRYNATGVFQDNPFIINDSTGRVSMTEGLDVNTAQQTAGDLRVQSTNSTRMLLVDSSADNILIDAADTLTTADGTLHIHTASAGTVTANTFADDLVIENSAEAGISILAPDATRKSIYFGEPSNNPIAQLFYGDGSFTMDSDTGIILAPLGTSGVTIATSFVDMEEISEPSAPVATKYRTYLETGERLFGIDGIGDKKALDIGILETQIFS